MQSDKEAYWAAVRTDLNVFLSQSFNTKLWSVPRHNSVRL